MLLREAVNTMPIALLIINPDEVLVDVNEKGLIWFGSIIKLGDNIKDKFFTDESKLPKTDFLLKSGHFQVGTYIYRFVTSSFESELLTYYCVCIIEDTEGYQSLSNAKTVVDALQKTIPKLEGEKVCNVDTMGDGFKMHCVEGAGMGLASDSDSTMILYSPKGIIIECSNDFRGYTREELIGTAAFDCIHPDDIPSTAEKHVEFVEDNRKIVPILSFFRKKHKKGHYVHCEFSGAMKYGNENEEGCIEGIERVLSTDRMQRVVSSVLNQIPCGVLMVDTVSGNIDMCNRNASNWLNIERYQNFENRLNKLSGTLFSDNEFDKLLSCVKTCHDGVKTDDGITEMTVRTIQGKVFTFVGRSQEHKIISANASATSSSSSTEQMDVSKGSHSVLWIVNDVTVLSHAMEKKTDSILQFMRCTSHDMRTPMQAIALAAHSLKDELKLLKHANTEVDTIISSSAVLETIVSNILEFKNINSMKLVKELSSIDVKDKIDKIVDILRHSTLLSDKVKLFGSFIDWEKAPHLLSLDEKMLDRIILNIVSNALKFTQEGKVEVVCSMSNCMQEGQLSALSVNPTTSDANLPLVLCITVNDTGRGMDANAVKHLGDLDFFAGDEGGFGLGTYIVSTYIKFLNGNMKVKSKVGEGTSVTIRIPTSAVNAYKRGLSSSSSSESWEVEGAAETREENVDSNFDALILVVEDVSINRKLLIKSLIKGGFTHIEEAENGKIALEMMLEKNYRTVFMDINMPVMNGDEAVKEYWKGYATRCLGVEQSVQHPKIIMLTGNITDGDRESAIACGAHEFLTKPVRPKKLIEAATWVGIVKTPIHDEVAIEQVAVEESVDDQGSSGRSVKKMKIND